ncbi:MAG: extracellular solute-binding protein [Alphaproteobacteria bacterium]|nr:extracellular solute-binding protein [Alphaproteobacteria bacterium]
MLHFKIVRHGVRFLFILLCVIAGYYYVTQKPTPVVNVYNWYAMLPKDVLDDFYDETGIHVCIDYYDNNEVLEAKLFAGNSGYDVVFPSASPYMARQIKAGIYQKLDKTLIPNFDDLQTILLDQIRIVDPDNSYSIPYYWGTLGIAFNEDMIKARMPNAPMESYALLFNPEIVKNFHDCGVTLLEEAVDIYPLILLHLGKDVGSSNMDDLIAAQRHMMRIRPYIRRFSSSRLVGELMNGETCLAQAWSGDTQVAIREAKKLGKNLRYVIPKEGTTLWIDAIVIPKDAPNAKNAHIFINFLLRPDIAARVSLFTLLATATKGAFPYLPKEFVEDESVFPKPEVMQKLQLDQDQELEYERERNRMWTNFRLNRRD